MSIPSLFRLIVRMRELERQDSQFIIATHSPILLAYPGADIFEITSGGFERREYEETEQYRLTKYFVSNYAKVIRDLLGGGTR